MRYLFCLVFPLLLIADELDELANIALKKAPQLIEKSYELQTKRVQALITKRWFNPSVELEQANYLSQEDGYALTLTQPIRVNQQIKTLLSQDIQKSAKADFIHTKASYIHQLALLYSDYITITKLLALKKEEIALSQTIFQKVDEQFQAKTTTKSVQLQAQLEYDTQKLSIYSLEQKKIDLHYQLLNFLGVKSYSFELDYNFPLKGECGASSQIAVLKNLYKQAQTNLKLQSYLIDELRIHLGYDKESQDRIFTIGVGFDIPLFNKKKEEQQIAKLQLLKLKELLRKKELQIAQQLKSLSLQRALLLQSIQKQKRMLTKEKKLIKLLLEDYRYTRSNLLEILRARNLYIKTKKELLQLKNRLFKNSIQINYLKGCYND